MKRWEREYLDYNDLVEVVLKPLPQERPVPLYMQKAKDRRELALDLRTYGLTSKEVAAYLGVSVTRAYQIVNHAKREIEHASRRGMLGLTGGAGG